MNALTDDSSSDDEYPVPYTEVKKTVITMLALPHDAEDGNHTVYIDRPDPATGEIATFALCTLHRSRCPHVRCETMFVDSPVRMWHTGGSVVSITGYETLEVMNYAPGGTVGESDSESDDDEFDYGKALLGEEGDESDSESQSDVEAPELVELAGQGTGIMQIPSASEDDSVEDADVSDSDLQNMDVGGMSSSSDDDDDDDDDEDDSSSGDDESNSEADGSDDGSGDSSDESDGDGDEKMAGAEQDFDSDESLSMSDSDSDEAREAMRKRLKQLATPQPGKKQKVDSKVPASAPAKVKAVKVPTNEAEYEAALKAFIEENGGEVKVAMAGSIKRPSAVGKLTKYLNAKRSVFAYNKQTGTIRLA